MFSLSFQDSFFRRLVPSALRSGVVSELQVPSTASTNFFLSFFVCKGLNFISLFAQPGVLHVSELSVDCLTYV